jgi:hypothetical protein
MWYEKRRKKLQTFMEENADLVRTLGAEKFFELLYLGKYVYEPGCGLSYDEVRSAIETFCDRTSEK